MIGTICLLIAFVVVMGMSALMAIAICREAQYEEEVDKVKKKFKKSSIE